MLVGRDKFSATKIFLFLFFENSGKKHKALLIIKDEWLLVKHIFYIIVINC